jgi:hypothetical protein
MSTEEEPPSSVPVGHETVQTVTGSFQFPPVTGYTNPVASIVPTGEETQESTLAESASVSAGMESRSLSNSVEYPTEGQESSSASEENKPDAASSKTKDATTTPTERETYFSETAGRAPAKAKQGGYNPPTVGIEEKIPTPTRKIPLPVRRNPVVTSSLVVAKRVSELEHQMRGFRPSQKTTTKKKKGRSRKRKGRGKYSQATMTLLKIKETDSATKEIRATTKLPKEVAPNATQIKQNYAMEHSIRSGDLQPQATAFETSDTCNMSEISYVFDDNFVIDDDMIRLANLAGLNIYRFRGACNIMNFRDVDYVCKQLFYYSRQNVCQTMFRRFPLRNNTDDIEFIYEFVSMLEGLHAFMKSMMLPFMHPSSHVVTFNDLIARGLTGKQMAILTDLFYDEIADFSEQDKTCQDFLQRRLTNLMQIEIPPVSCDNDSRETRNGFLSEAIQETNDIMKLLKMSKLHTENGKSLLKILGVSTFAGLTFLIARLDARKLVMYLMESCQMVNNKKVLHNQIMEFTCMLVSLERFMKQARIDYKDTVVAAQMTLQHLHTRGFTEEVLIILIPSIQRILKYHQRHRPTCVCQTHSCNLRTETHSHTQHHTGTHVQQQLSQVHFPTDLD